MEIPEHVLHALTGLPRHGEPEHAIPLLSVDDGGWPHVCLLSRAQLQGRPGGVAAAITSYQTRINLLTRPRPTLLLVAPTAATYCKLRLAETIDDGWALAVRLDLVVCRANKLPHGA